jgi:hypothetical protein
MIVLSPAAACRRGEQQRSFEMEEESMTEPMGTPLGETAPKKSRTWLIVLIVVLVVCCLCVVGGGGIYWLWNNGDRLFGLTSALLAGPLA